MIYEFYATLNSYFVIEVSFHTNSIIVHGKVVSFQTVTLVLEINISSLIVLSFLRIKSIQQFNFLLGNTFLTQENSSIVIFRAPQLLGFDIEECSTTKYKLD